ncbi:MAG: prepilin-type N-terminal cleavage/methylation domain-containing protein [Kiritimatiellae bacterium]|nr:prepilin-type N-terminal cleavage/methylation domain-containing protein [Kiritimatiellia bacterium]
MRDKRAAFTLFELLAVLTITGIIFMVILGRYNSWSAVQACNGATRILKGGLLQARTLAQARNKYVGFEFSTVISNNIQQITGFQIYLCTNETGNTEQLLRELHSATVEDQMNIGLGISLAAPFQRLSNSVTFVNPLLETPTKEEGSFVFFRPDGSVWSDLNEHTLYVTLYTRRLFNKKPLTRTLRVDLATGLIETLKGEQPNAQTVP